MYKQGQLVVIKKQFSHSLFFRTLLYVVHLLISLKIEKNQNIHSNTLLTKTKKKHLKLYCTPKKGTSWKSYHLNLQQQQQTLPTPSHFNF